MPQYQSAQQAAPRSRPQTRPPGLGLAAAIAAISAALSGFWLMSAGAAPPRATAPGASELAEVKDAEIGAALTTLDPSNAALARFQTTKDSCRPPLAWVSLVSPPGQPPATVRLISGEYVSPAFEVTPVPVRVAIPYPRPYETGHGAISVVDIGGSATISLLPAWQVTAKDGRVTRQVTWLPVKRCAPSNG